MSLKFRYLINLLSFSYNITTIYLTLVMLYSAKSVDTEQSVPISFLTHAMQGAKKIIFTACHSGKLKLAFTSPDIISTSPPKAFDEQN